MAASVAITKMSLPTFRIMPGAPSADPIPQARARLRGGDSYSLAQSVAIFTKTLPGWSVSFSERLVTFAAKNDANPVNAELAKIVYPAMLAGSAATGAGCRAAEIHRQ